MLARKLWEKGFAVLRAPASGAKARRLKYPDMVAMRNGVIIVLEIKTSERKGPIYVPREQVEKLLEFTRRAGGIAFIAVDYVGSGLGWRFVPVEMLEETRGGNYRVSPELVEKALRLGDLVRLTDKTVGLDAFMSEREALDES